jgi:hypothetical protein
MLPLLVPFEEKDEVKKLGAQWDMELRIWQWPENKDRTSVRKWLPRMYRGDLSSPYIVPALVPESMWGVNLRAILPKEKWDELRKECYRSSCYRCQVCGTRGTPPHCNEQWVFNLPANKNDVAIQKLVRLSCLCKPCHMIKHLGYASVSGQLEETLAHMARINGWSKKQASKEADKAFEDWEERNLYDWSLNLDFLVEKYGLKISLTHEELQDLNQKFFDNMYEKEDNDLLSAFNVCKNICSSLRG